VEFCANFIAFLLSTSNGANSSLHSFPPRMKEWRAIISCCYFFLPLKGMRGWTQRHWWVHQSLPMSICKTEAGGISGSFTLVSRTSSLISVRDCAVWRGIFAASNPHLPAIARSDFVQCAISLWHCSVLKPPLQSLGRWIFQLLVLFPSAQLVLSRCLILHPDWQCASS